VRERGAAVFQLQPDDDDNSWLDCWRTGWRYVSLLVNGAYAKRTRAANRWWLSWFL
jgi:hypothetical protein